jgi:AraC-like DNA-binding protein
VEFLFEKRTPRPPVSDYIESLWYARGQIGYWREHILPQSGVVLMVNLGAKHRALLGGDDGDERINDRSWVCGVQTRAMINEPLGPTHVLGASFRDHGAYPFLRIPVAELADDIVPLESLWGRFADELRDRIHEAGTIVDRLAAFETALAERLDTSFAPRRPVDIALARLREGHIAIRTLSDDLGVSQKHLIAVFKRLVGATPKLLGRMFRFNRLLDELDHRATVDWARTAAAGGYYDQAHLIRDFRQFALATPTEYVRQRQTLYGDLEPGENAAFMPVDYE